MIREYIIIKLAMQQEGDDDEEVIALVKDLESYDEFYVVINDYFLSHYPEHVWGSFKKLQIGDRIKGELVLINCQTMPLKNGCFFTQKKSFISSINYRLIHSSVFKGQFEVLRKDKENPFSVKYPYGNYDMRVDENRMIAFNSTEIALRGELYLETVGEIISSK